MSRRRRESEFERWVGCRYSLYFIFAYLITIPYIIWTLKTFPDPTMNEAFGTIIVFSIIVVGVYIGCLALDYIAFSISKLWKEGER